MFVMKKVEDAARLVCDIGERCEEHNLKELPARLSKCFASLKTYVIHPRIIASLSYFSELDGIKGALEQRKKIVGLKKFLLRKDGKVKQYNDKLSSVLESFRVCHC